MDCPAWVSQKIGVGAGSYTRVSSIYCLLAGSLQWEAYSRCAVYVRALLSLRTISLG